MLSDDKMEKMSRDELIEHVRKMQETMIAGNNNFSVEERRVWQTPLRLQQSQQQKPVLLSRRSTNLERNSFLLSECTDSSHGSMHKVRVVRRVGEESNVLSNTRLSSTSQEGMSLGTMHGGDTNSVLSHLSGIPSTQAAALPDPLPVAQRESFSRPTSNNQYSFSASTKSMAIQYPARWTGKLSVFRGEDGTKHINHYQIIKEIGRGACGKVQLAYDMENNTLVAIKVVKRADTKFRIGGQTNAQKQFSALQREIAVMKKLRHKNIVSLYEVIDDPNAKKLYLVMMYVDKGPIGRVNCPPDAKEDTQVCTPIPKNELAWYARQILAGLEYLHQHKIVHRDIKPENILVDRNKHVFLADFGVAEVFDTSNRERMEAMMHESLMAIRASGGTHQGQGISIQGTKGTMLFMAPELWKGDSSYASPVDMWALGVTLYILLTGMLPFITLDDIMDPALPVIPTSYGDKWTDLLQGLLDRDPSKRITVRAARAIVKSMNEEGESPEANQLFYPTAITQADLEGALTPAQQQKDQDDMEWLLGPHVEECWDAPTATFSKGLPEAEEGSSGYCLPFLVCNGDNNSLIGTATDGNKETENIQSPKTAKEDVLMRPQNLFLGPEKTSAEGRLFSTPEGDPVSRKRLLPFLEGEERHDAATKRRDKSMFTPNSNLPVVHSGGRAATRFKSKSGFFSMLREALSFSRSKKSNV
ncbi:protein kinase, putative [Trypanosoma cruzi marinkellei]|uniref:non-specific serine/threonine protein kinase n=1 Tax=Trypanosoma cruzi marinkellei TaxID=85056 RepID=K2NIL9_TRYCR|nr:protein kinase, putative [Trypanosoma cruzi marinkellei]